VKVYVELLGKIAKGDNPRQFWMFLNDDASLNDLLETIARDKGIKINIKETAAMILVNGRPIRYPEDLGARLKEFDKILIMSPVVAGG
jgi:molybdopterin converting factor small subunit